MAITVTDFRTKFPEFSSVTDDQIELGIAEAEIEIEEEIWGTLNDFGLYYLTAHLLSPSISVVSGLASGPVTGRSVSDMSVQFGSTTSSMSEADFNDTSYGRRFLRLAEKVGYHVMVI